QPALSVRCPDPVTVGACMLQADLNNAYAAWLAQFQTIGGCSPTSTDLANYQTPPSACSATDIVISITYEAYDDCNTATCTSTFTVPAQPALSVSCPEPMTVGACMSQVDLNTAYANWLAQFRTFGGCNPVSTNLANYQTPPSACSATDIVITINYQAQDDCNTESCSATFTVPAQPALSVSCPAPVTIGACESYMDLNTAYANWLAGFRTMGGCSPVSTDLSSYQTPPSACSRNNRVVTINYSAADGCNQTACSSTFTVLAQPRLSVSCPEPMAVAACTSQTDINIAYAAWLAQFQTFGGCSPVSTNLANYQTPPSACSANGVATIVTISYEAKDDCNEATCTSTFTVPAQPALSVRCPDPVTVGACMLQADLNNAYAAWLAQFQTIGGCSPTSTDLANYQTPPSACSATDIVISITYEAYDDCNTATCTSTFTVPAQPALSVRCPDPVTVGACMLQADLNNAYAAWLAQFQTIGGCSPTSTDLANYQTPPSACSATDIVISITYMASDDCNLVSCTSTFTVPAQPVLSVNCPGSVTVGPCISQEDLNTAYAAWLGQFQTFGGCSPMSTDLANFQTAPVICQDEDVTVTINYSASDDCNTAACSATFTVIMDVDPPVFDPEAMDMTVECDGEGNAAELNAWLASHGNAIATDNCVAITWTDDFEELSDLCGATGAATVTFTATDGCGNANSTTATFTIEDTQAPMISFDLPDGATMDVECNIADPNWTPFMVTTDDLTIEDACSSRDMITVTYEDVLIAEGICGVSDFLSLWRCTWTATDDCGNSSTYTLFLRIIDTQPPNWTSFPEDVTIECGAALPQTRPTATDNCSEIRLTASDRTVPGACANTYTVIRTWTAIDGCGNATSQDQVINVQDTTAPVIVFTDGYVNTYTNGQAVYTDCEEWGRITALSYAATAVDNCAGPRAVDFWFDDHGTFDCAEYGYTGYITTYWRATDECGNTATSSLHWYLVDRTPPTLSNIPADACVTVLPPVPNNIQVVDDCEFATLAFTQSDPVACDNVQYIERTWTATDVCGNTATATQRLTLIDTEGPTVTIDYPGLTGLASGSTARLEANCTEDGQAILANLLPFVVVDDGCSGVTFEFSTELVGSGDCNSTGYLARYTLRVVAKDVCNNTTNYTLNLELVDTTPPVVSAPAQITVNCGAAIPFPAVADLCSGVADISFVGLQPSVVSCPSNPVYFQRVWTVTDACGNRTDFTQDIAIVDQTGPVFRNVPADACDDTSIPTAVTAIDECSGTNATVVLTETTTNPAECGQILTRTWRAMDACGNVSTATQQVFFTDNVAPTIRFTHPLLTNFQDEQELVLPVGLGYGNPHEPIVFAPGDVQVVDNCAANLTATVQLSLLSEGDCDVDGYLARYRATWTAVDPCGNRTAISILVTYVDTYAPEIFQVPADLVLYCDDPIPAPGTVFVKDDYTQGIEPVFTETSVPTAFGTRITRSWEATDECGNSTKVVQYIDIYDNTLACAFNIPEIISCNSAGNTLTVNVTGGTAPYTYSWDMTDCDGFITAGANTRRITYTVGFTTQNFSVTITDANGCEHVCTTSIACIKQTETPIDIFGLTGPNTGLVAAYPNPVDQLLNVKAAYLVGEKLTLGVYNIYGQEVLFKVVAEWPQEGLELDTRLLPNGTYLLRLQSENGQPVSRQIVVLH
ncbi:MAG: hypothetical protein C7N36_04390, partial [Bacteroidetes bacterium]